MLNLVLVLPFQINPTASSQQLLIPNSPYDMLNYDLQPKNSFQDLRHIATYTTSGRGGRQQPQPASVFVGVDYAQAYNSSAKGTTALFQGRV